MSERPSFDRLLGALEKLPGIGPKGARRLGFHLLSAPPSLADGLVSAIVEARERTRPCSTCHALTETDPCGLCGDPSRDERLLCVVEEVADVDVLERTRELHGRYHVLGGALAPLRGIGPENLNVEDLLARISKEKVEEVVLATNPNVEGEATALYLARRLKPLSVRITRLAFGLPVGAALEFADEVTLTRSLQGRREI